MIQDKWNEVLEQFRSRVLRDGQIKVDEDAGEVVVEGLNFRFVTTINEKWIGYDFVLKKQLLGVEMSSWSDTDNYALDFEPTVTEEVYQDVKRFVASLLGNKVYYGKIKNRPVLAWPCSETQYTISFAPRLHFFTKNEIVPMHEIVDNKELFALEAV